jgi:small subunit ribosomal protein S20
VKTLANCKSAEKRIRVAKVKTLANTMKKSALRTSIRRFNEAIASSDESAKELLGKSFKLIDSAVSKNILHKNTGARRKAKLARMLNSMQVAK